MSKTKKASEPSGTTRVTISFPSPLYERVREIKEETNSVTMADVIRQALAMYDFAVSEQSKGNEIYSDGPAGKSRMVFIK